MPVRKVAVIASLFMTQAALLPPTQAQRVLRTNSQSSTQPGSVSQDLLDVYESTKSATTEQAVTSIARACSKVIPDPARGKVDREYAASLLAWALNRRGEMRSERAAELVKSGDLSAGDALDRQAAEDFKTAIEYGPANWRTHHNYAISLAMMGDYRSGIQEFSRAIELQPDYSNAYFNRGELYFEIHEYARAESDYGRAISINASDPQYYNSRAHCRFMLEDYEQAIADYRRSAELGSDSAVYLTDLADAYQFRGQWKLAAEAYQRAVANNNRYARAYQNAAWLMATCPEAEIRNQELSLSAAKRALSLEAKDSAKALDTLAAAMANASEYTEAAKLMRQAIEVSEDDEERRDLQQRLDLYSQRRAYRQPKQRQTSVATNPADIEQYRIRTASRDSR